METNIKGCKTNHSLRATAATQMFQEGVPEKIIQERTGHRSLEGLRAYEHLCEPQHKAVSSLLSANTSVASNADTYNRGLSVLSIQQPARETSVSINLEESSNKY